MSNLMVGSTHLSERTVEELRELRRKVVRCYSRGIMESRVDAQPSGETYILAERMSAITRAIDDEIWSRREIPSL